jgi:alpha-mannosidase
VSEARDLVILQNEYLLVTLDRHTGHLVSVVDKRSGEEALSGPGNVLQAIAEVPGRSTGWVIALDDELHVLRAPESVEIVQSGPVEVTARVAYRYRDSYFVQETTLTCGMPRVDFCLHAEWYERDCCLKVAFPSAAEGGGTATFEAPLGSIARPARGGAEVPAQRWIDVSNDARGVSLLNDCRYAFDVEGSRLRMTVVRGIPDLDPEADVGAHELRYALYPHAGDWRAGAGDTVRQGWAFNMPLIARQALRRAGMIAPWIARGINHAMPPAFGFLGVAPPNVVLSAFKLEQEDWGPGSPVVVRLYETAGLATEARLTLPAPLMMFEETNHLEEPVESDRFRFGWDENEVTIDFGPHEIKTFRFRLAIPAFAIYPGEEHRDDLAPGEVPGFEGG